MVALVVELGGEDLTFILIGVVVLLVAIQTCRKTARGCARALFNMYTRNGAASRTLRREEPHGVACRSGTRLRSPTIRRNGL